MKYVWLPKLTKSLWSRIEIVEALMARKYPIWLLALCGVIGGGAGALIGGYALGNPSTGIAGMIGGGLGAFIGSRYFSADK